MRFVLATAFLVFALSSKVSAVELRPIADPLAFSLDFMTLLEKSGANEAVGNLAEAMGRKDAAKEIVPHFVPFEKTKPRKIGVLADRNYNDLVRVVTVYMFGISSNFPFVYFQFTYKRMENDWAITNVNMLTETQLAFPAQMAPHIR